MKRCKALLGAIAILFGQSCVSVANAMDQETIIRRLEAIERKNNDLEKENIELKRRLSRVESNNPSARNNKVSHDNFREANNLHNANNTKSLKIQDNAKTQFSSLDEPEFISYQNEVSKSANKSNLDIYNDRHFELSASFLGLMPSTSNLVYGTEVSPYPAPTPNWNDRTITPSFSPTFGIGAKYSPSKSNDIELNWVHLATAASASVGVNTAKQMVGPSWLLGSQASNYATAFGKGVFAYDSINLEVGHTFCAECDFKFRPYAGVQFVDLSQNLSNLFTNAHGATFHTNGLNFISTNTTSGFMGAGPRLGFGSTYKWNDFEFIGKMGTGLMIGTQQSKYAQTTTCSDGCIGLLTYNGSTIVGNNQAYTTPNTTQVIPTIDAKLATAYTFAPTSSGQFKIELGWQAAAYFNTVSQYIMTNLCPCDVPDAPTGLYLATGQHTLNNFTVQGPYITGKWAY